MKMIRSSGPQPAAGGNLPMALSAQCGLAQQTISYMERGLRQPSFETILRIADGIGVDLEDVIRKARASVPKRNQK
jgi:transcriptional regulator with XRE-family HTH domain